MKRTPLLITLAIVVTIAGGYYLYSKIFHKAFIRGWDVVPAESIFVYEGSNCKSCLNDLRASSVVKLVNLAIFPPEDRDSLKNITDIVLQNFQQGAFVSLHATKKDDFDFIFYLPNTDQLKTQFKVFVDQLGKNGSKLKISERQYNDVTIYEGTSGKRTFSWVELDNIWVASFTPILIEDVVRTYNHEARSFGDEISEAYKLPTVRKDGGNIYLNMKKATQWLTLFTNDEPSLLLRQFGESALLDVKISDKTNFVLNGFCLDSARNPSYFLSTFSSQKPVSFNLKNYVSNRAVMVATYGISDGKAFSKDLKAFNNTARHSSDSLAKISDTYKVNLTDLTGTITGEMGLCWLEAKGNTLSKVLIVNSSSADQWISTFNRLSEQVSIDTIFYEKYADYEIRELPVFRLPEKLLWPLVSGFNSSYYTKLGNAVIIGDDLEQLKRFLDDIDREETWGKSVAHNKYLESTLLESNISLYINTPRVWNILEASLHGKWKTFLSDNRVLVNSIGMGALQFSHLNDSYYTNISWNYKVVSSGGQASEATTTDKTITNVDEAITQMHVIRSHISKRAEVLIQDSTRLLRQVSAEGKVLWQLQLDGPLTGAVEEVDFFNNGKLQYFFATPGKLHVVDRLGNYVKPFPVSITEREIDFVSIVDYDHSKKYRFLIAGKSGKLWMYDKQGTNLEGWTPKNLENELFAAPRHYRIRGKDYVVAIRRDGNAYVLNRRGETLKGFPINLNARPVGGYSLEQGSSLQNTNIVVISRDGFRIKFNLEGKIPHREALVKNAADARFGLIEEQDGKSYLILRQEPRQLALFDDDLKELVSSDFVGNNQARIKFLDYGAGRKFITITDQTQDLSYVYNGAGKLLTAIPVESSVIALQPVDLERIRIYSALDKSLTIQQF
ncbi:DUF3352 domain-containing protein [Chryseolinea sp. T2]|uniref:DUF3352 domain-containing protein n=1 Tax=Chryseolinea sp. T2 TaxID=3129255 RepID=UPI003077611C